MSFLLKKIRRAFTIVEVVIVIAIIAILAAVLFPTISNIFGSSKKSKTLQEARNAWKQVAYTYSNGYFGFIGDNRIINGWRYDYLEDIAKYDNNGITYDLNPNGTYYVTAGAAGHRYV